MKTSTSRRTKRPAADKATIDNVKLALAERAKEIRTGQPAAKGMMIVLSRKELHPDCSCGECTVGHFRTYTLPTEKWAEICAALELGGAKMIEDQRAAGMVVRIG